MDGRKTFQVNLIRRSYRMRGRAARAQINPHPNRHVSIIAHGTENMAEIGLGIRIKNDRNLRNSIFVYSAIKIRANLPALYSTLKPDTSSLSPSAKSKGARLASARHVVSQIAATGGIRRKENTYDFIRVACISKDLNRSKIPNSVRAILTS